MASAPCGARTTSCRTALKEAPIDAHLLAVLILTPFVLAFVYAGLHEYLRFKSDGRVTYGLVFDEETGTSYVTGLGESGEAYDPKAFNPDAYNDPEITEEPAGSKP